ncbi:hypothetical protein ACFFF5_18080 [Lederbergia wuyishanensis]|uniref:Uncharacterized protein n=1 Tax=Lederbergia wuyishanensis TaxID=1347903 RepID=A0ABU0D4P5_9BACI|nr:hypothetical protein [Lederbergia wuyishanensis]MCJ8008064.1 hypothetical protein [Lederbergia wuyishanensis]MDQ0343351.1 hypothetical protein [Lederbergia wuyishanensis]
MPEIITETDKLRVLYSKRPFKVRNADEFDTEQILDLFIDPTEGLTNPFDFENVIVKGKMGTGKTMYLRANHACYLYSVVPSILHEEEIILPVYIRLSDFQHISDPIQIYNSFILKFIEELSSVFMHLQDSRKLANLHNGITSLPPSIFGSEQKVATIFNELRKLSADEYVEKIQKDLNYSGKAKPNFFEISAEYREGKVLELKEKRTPGISDINHAYDTLLKDFNGKILLLIDEAGSINKSFFKGEEGEPALFEVLMNQLRTLDFVRTKIAVYPNSFSDILNETRYGDVVWLQEDITNEEGFQAFREKALALVERYISNAMEDEMKYDFLFSLAGDEGDLFEQLINASNGNIRRFVQLLDQSLSISFKQNKGTDVVKLEHVNKTLKEHAISMESLFSEVDRDFLVTLADTCKSRGTFRFQFPNKSLLLSKYVNKSAEYNILNIIDNGTGRKGTTYAFDYAYCFYHDIPTHHIQGAERIDKSRSKKTGSWIKKVTKISDNIIEHATFPGKIEGSVVWIRGDAGFIKGDDGIDYYFDQAMVIQEDKDKSLFHEKRVRFIPSKSERGAQIAFDIEIL